jgi:hypothetical protein
MDFDSHYYSSRCKDINGVWVSKGTLMTFVGGDTWSLYVFYSKIKELFVLAWSLDNYELTELCFTQFWASVFLQFAWFCKKGYLTLFFYRIQTQHFSKEGESTENQHSMLNSNNQNSLFILKWGSNQSNLVTESHDFAQGWAMSLVSQ